jgi:hypothetical protein
MKTGAKRRCTSGEAIDHVTQIIQLHPEKKPTIGAPR